MNAKEVAATLISKGAILELLGLDAAVLIGAWDWIDDHRVFYFEAGASDEFGGHVLLFDEMRAPHELGVEFWDAHGTLVAYLAPIAEAVDDPASYQQTFH